MQFQDWMFDQRVLDRNIRRGLITRADYEKYLKGLPDAAGNSVTLDSDERSKRRSESREQRSQG